MAPSIISALCADEDIGFISTESLSNGFLIVEKPFVVMSVKRSVVLELSWPGNCCMVFSDHFK
jgi:hypothetical protein